jgi:signal transduction histidine kinase
MGEVLKQNLRGCRGQGTGLGLSLAYDIIKKGHGGALEAETVEGEGTVFIFQLPIKSNG